MAVVQSTYSTAIPNGYPGMVANGETSNRLTRSCEDAAGLAFGAPCFRGATDHGCTGTPAAGKFLGIAIANAGVITTSPTAAVDTYGQRGSVGILNRGVIWVNTSVAVNQGDAAYVTSGGLITNSAGVNTAIPAIFDDTIGAAGLVRLRVTP